MRSLDIVTVGRTKVPHGPIYVPEDSQESIPDSEQGSLLSIVNGALNPVPVCLLDQEVRKELIAESLGITLLGLKKRSELPSVTTTTGENYDDLMTWRLQLSALI